MATPIGNLADITLRALAVLDKVHAVACEDTRHTASLLTQYGLHKPLLALHQHNEAEASQAVLARLQAGERVAYVSDAGTPAISDPGARLARTVREAGLRVMPLPGASSVTTLLSAAGIEPTHTDLTATGFAFIGFLPTKVRERERVVQALADEHRAIVILEAPHRIQETAHSLSILKDRLMGVGRELTKQFEEVATVTCADLPAWLAGHPQRCKGEFALVLHPVEPASAAENGLPAQALHTLHLLLAELPVKTAVRLATDITRQPKNILYDAALAWKSAQADGD